MSEDRRIWSKAAAVALMRVAFAEKRKVVVVHYATSVVVRQIDPGDHAALVAMIRSFLQGGTDIALAIEESARQIVDLAKKGDTGADVALVTDGIDKERKKQEEALAKLSALNSRLWLIAIDQHVAKDHPLHAFACSYTFLDDKAMHDENGIVPLAGV